MKASRLIIFVVLLAMMPLIGCSGNVSLRGTVVLDDGTPVTTGAICFTDGTNMARGTINPDGTFEMGSVGMRDGLPPGTYTVYFFGIQVPGPANTITTVDAMGNVVEIEVMGSRPPLIDPRYERPETSGLQVEVTRQTRTMDFTLDRYRP